jgi:hypothetical protein
LNPADALSSVMPEGSIFWTFELSCGFELIFCAIGFAAVVPVVVPVDVPLDVPVVLPLPADVVDPLVVDVAVVVVPAVVFFEEWPCVVVVACPLP